MPSPLTYSQAPWLVTLGIPALALLVVLLLTLGVARARHREPALPRPGAVAAVLGIWAAVCLGLAELGVFARFDGRPPPPFALLLVSTIAATVSFGRSRFGERLARGLPLWLLVAAQCFRLPLELVMHRAASAGTMPVEMSFSGYNFDILSGSTALLLAIGLAKGQLGQKAAKIWNVCGLLLLINILVIAVLATPLFHAFGPRHLNLWVADAPFVLLPVILVPAALLGHLLIFHKLAQLEREAQSGRLSPISVSNKG